MGALYNQSEKGIEQPFFQQNGVTHWLDMSLVYGVGWRDETKNLHDEFRDTFFENGQFRFISEDEAKKHENDFNFICIEGGCLYNGK